MLQVIRSIDDIRLRRLGRNAALRSNDMCARAAKRFIVTVFPMDPVRPASTVLTCSLTKKEADSPSPSQPQVPIAKAADKEVHVVAAQLLKNRPAMH